MNSILDIITQNDSELDEIYRFNRSNPHHQDCCCDKCLHELEGDIIQSEFGFGGGYYNMPTKVYPLPILPDGRKPQISSGHYLENPERKPRTADHPKGAYFGHQGTDLMYLHDATKDPKKEELFRKRRMDRGSKFWSPESVWVMAYANGKIIYRGFSEKLGWKLKIRHADGLESSYLHLTEPIVKQGAEVKAGDRLAQLDKRGNPAHLHFEIREKGRYAYSQSVNPRKYLEAATMIQSKDSGSPQGNYSGSTNEVWWNPFASANPGVTTQQIVQAASQSKIAGYRWKDRGRAPLGYIKGMALVYARVYKKFLDGDVAALEMAKANTGNTEKDALAHYAPEFNRLGMSNDSAGVSTLRHLFVLLIGLGMRESGGKWCTGRDRSAGNTSAETAEAGLFQTSYNAKGASPILPKLFQAYSADPRGFLDVFKEGAMCKSYDLENFGTGNGKLFQELSKKCPAFAAEFTAVALRNRRKHWGPINRKNVEIHPECDKLLLEVQKIVDASPVLL